VIFDTARLGTPRNITAGQATAEANDRSTDRLANETTCKPLLEMHKTHEQPQNPKQAPNAFASTNGIIREHNLLE